MVQMKYNVGAQRTRGHSTTGDKSSSLQNSDASRLNTPTGDPHDAASAAYKTCVCAWLGPTFDLAANAEAPHCICVRNRHCVAPGFKDKTRYTLYVSPISQISRIATNKGNINRQCLNT